MWLQLHPVYTIAVDIAFSMKKERKGHGIKITSRISTILKSNKKTFWFIRNVQLMS